MSTRADDWVKAAYQAHAAPHATRARATLDAGVAVCASGATVRMSDGRELIDFSSGGFGYGDRRIVERVAQQMQSLALSSRHFLSRPLAAFVEAMARMAPGALEVTYPCNSGSEAVEGALKLARGHRPARTRVVAMDGAHHGSTLGALAVSGVARIWDDLLDQPVDVVRVPYDDLAAAARAVDEQTAAVIVEPIAAGAGVRVPTADYLTGLRALASAVGALLIVDEITTSLGRTGERFAVEREGVVPDVLLVGDALGGGVLPLAAYVTTRRVNDRVYRWRDPVMHASTTGGSPAACAAGLAVLEVLERERLEQSCAELAVRLHEGLARWRREWPACISGAHGRGLLAGLRLLDAATAREIQRRGVASGVLVLAGGATSGEGWITLRPPLTIAAGELDRGIEALDAAIEAVASGHVGNPA